MEFLKAESTAHYACVPSAKQRLNRNRRSRFCEVLGDGLTVRYTGEGKNSHDVGSIQSIYPLQIESSCAPVGYFELKVDESGDNGSIAIGLSTPEFSLMGQPGWEPKSYGFHSDDGNVFAGKGTGSTFVTPGKQGDIIGCGMLFRRRTVFFTRNGVMLAVPPIPSPIAESPCDLYPTVGLHSPGEVAIARFEPPFAFPVENIIQKEWEALIEVPRPFSHIGSPAECLKMVIFHLVEIGFVETASNLLSKVQMPHEMRAALDFVMSIKKAIRESISSGSLDDTAESFQMVASACSDAGQQTALRSAVYEIRRMVVLELCVAGKQKDALLYAREHLGGAPTEFLKEIMVRILQAKTPPDGRPCNTSAQRKLVSVHVCRMCRADFIISNAVMFANAFDVDSSGIAGVLSESFRALSSSLLDVEIVLQHSILLLRALHQ
eukprot:ANDGO_06749.mRNA.1 Ran-binding proteins 9/10 homolog